VLGQQPQVGGAPGRAADEFHRVERLAAPFTGALNKIADLKMAAPLSPCHEESELDLWFAFSLCQNKRFHVQLVNDEGHILSLKIFIRHFRPIITLPADDDLPEASAPIGRSGI
jgi:hypothetical protein